MAQNLIRINVVAQKMGNVHVSYAWRKLASDPKAPKPIKLGARLTVFDEENVDHWIAGLVKAAQDKPAKTIGKSVPVVVAA
jgi:predicted DNA-binding transcriptional regulator AlpA